MVAYTNTVILDSFNYLHVCKASRANCPLKCFNNRTRTMASENAKLVVDRNRRKISLRAIIDIAPHNEILWKYGPQYKYPVFEDDL